ncbi:MAG: ABC transporter substrate-binding protein [Stellaceae bacterium]
MKNLLFAFLALSLGVVGVTNSARAASGYKIGWVASFSGIGSAWSESGTRGIKLATDAINAGNLAGAPITVITADDSGNPRTASDVCERLALQDKVVAIVGFEPTPARLACNQAALKAHIPYVASTGTAGNICFPNMVTDGVISNQMVGPLISYLMKEGKHKFYMIGSDYSVPKDTMKLATAVITKAGGTVVGRSFMPMGTADFSAEFAKISAAKPDAVLINVVGTDDLTFHKQFANDPRVSHIARADLLLFESVAHVLGASGKGIVAVGNYFATIKSPANAAFRADFTKHFGNKLSPDANTVNAYNGLMLLAAALKQGGGDEAKVMAALEMAKIAGPNGEVRIVHRFAAQRTYIGRATGTGAIQVIEHTAPIMPKTSCK